MTSKKSGFAEILNKDKRDRELQDRASAIADKFLSEINATNTDEDMYGLMILCSMSVNKMIASGNRDRATAFLQGVLGMAQLLELPPSPKNLM